MRYPAPENYGEFSSFELLGALWRGVIPADHRLIHALVDEPSRTLPGIVQFAQEDLEDRDDSDTFVRFDLVRLFNRMPTPEAIPFLVDEVRKSEGDVSDELTEALVRLGAAAFEPLMALFDEHEEGNKNRGEAAFLLATLGVRDSRMDDLLRRIEKSDPEEATFLRSIVEAERGPLEPYDIWKDYPEIDEPSLIHLPEDELYELLDSEWPSHRLWVAHALEGEELPDIIDEKLEAMLRDPAEPLAVRCAVAVLLAPWHAGSKIHHEVIRSAYEAEETRPDALKAMYLTFDEKYGPQMARHIEDTNQRVRYQALVGVGYLNVRTELTRVEKMLKDPDWREDSLFTYAMVAPGANTEPGVRKLLEQIRETAGGLDEEEEDTVKEALDNRLGRVGRDPIFFPEMDFGDSDDDDDDFDPDEDVDDPIAPQRERPHLAIVDAPITPVRSEKIGRNELCPCGSGKKYKKCCGK